MKSKRTPVTGALLKERLDKSEKKEEYTKILKDIGIYFKKEDKDGDTKS